MHKRAPQVAVLAGVATKSTPPVSRCYRTRRTLSSILRYSLEVELFFAVVPFHEESVRRDVADPGRL
jgi:hypothetical protein